MSDISNRVAYLKGLAEGMNLSEKSDEGKLITKLIDVLTDAADEIEALWAKNDELEMIIEELDNELGLAETDIECLFDELDSMDEYEDFDEEDDFDDDFLDEFYDEDEDDLFEIMCPECGEDVVVDFEMLDEEGNIVCPNCHKEIELEFDMDDDEE